MAKQLDLLSWREPCRIVAFPAGRLFGRARALVRLRETRPASEMERIWQDEVDFLDAAMRDAGLAASDRDQHLDAFADLVRACIADADGDAWGASGGDAA